MSLFLFSFFFGKIKDLGETCNYFVFNVQVNPRAKVSVKLVAEAGIGTVASGVAKGNADIIQVLNVVMYT